MKEILIGRETETAKLTSYLSSERSEFIAVSDEFKRIYFL